MKPASSIKLLLEEQVNTPVLCLPEYMIWEAMEDTGLSDCINDRKYAGMVREGQDEHGVLVAFCRWSSRYSHYIFYTLAETKRFRYRKFCNLEVSCENMPEIQEFLMKQCRNFLKRTNGMC